jgi:hypothetical protein
MFTAGISFSQIYNQKFSGGVKSLDAKTRTSVVNRISKLLDKNYVYPEVAKKMSELVKSKLRNHEYDTITNAVVFAQILTADLQSVSNDKHLHVNYNPEFAAKLKEMEKNQEDLNEDEEFIEKMKYENYAFKKVERLEGNIGYIDFRNFAPTKYSEDVIAAAMEFVSNTDAVIIDLRKNGGGEPEAVRLICSYFFGNKPVHLNDLYMRPEDETQEYWTLKKVDGKKMPDVDLYVLTSSFTFSGAEEFAYNMKNLKRATIVGETTGGGAHPGGPMRVNENYVMFVPVGKAINPISKTNWEGTGVSPDVPVSQEKALETAQLLALEKIVQKKKDPAEKKEIQWMIEGLKSILNPVSIDESTLKTFAGKYEVREVTLENGKLFYQRKDRPKFELIPMGEDLFRIKELEYFRIRFERDSENKVVGLIGLYSDGHSDKSIRTN